LVISFSALPRTALLVWRPPAVAIEVQPSRKATARRAIAPSYPQNLNFFFQFFSVSAFPFFSSG